MDINQIRLLAKAERMMDAGEIPWVWSITTCGQYERLSVTPEIMKLLELEQGQTVNSFIVNAIAELSLRTLRIRMSDLVQEIEDQQLTNDFDFRKEMDK